MEEHLLFPSRWHANVRSGVPVVTHTRTIISAVVKPLRDLADFKGEALINGVLEVVDRMRPLHLSIVGGDPLVRYRELEVLVPQLVKRGVHVQIVTSAFRQISPSWRALDHVNVVVSIDGLQPEHDVRRKPATYDRILKSIAGQRITVHCTVTSQMVDRPGYLDEFLKFDQRTKSPKFGSASSHLRLGPICRKSLRWRSAVRSCRS